MRFSGEVLVMGRVTEPRPRLQYLPGLDGLRAIAVLAVLLYHAEVRRVAGGFLGVEVFFVISGYLITTLLFAEWQMRGRIDLPGFWLRRARRLLPALFLMMAAALAFAVLFLPREVASLRGDAAAAALYVSNWYLVLSHKPYFEMVGRPSLLRHLWSLAVEEQFYLLWPLLFAAGLRIFRRRRILLAVLLAAALSSLWMALLHRPDADPSRVYYGTDTRAAGLLVGAALALVWVPGQIEDRAPGWCFDLLGLTALAALVFLCLWLNEYQAFLYQGGFALVALATAAAIMAAVHPRARLGARLLGWAPLRWAGLRSYSIYLWHWPVFMVTRAHFDVPLAGLPLLALRFGLTGLLAELSYRCIEVPFRSGALGRSWKALSSSQGTQRWRLGLRWAGAAGALLAFSVLLGMSVGAAQPPAPPSYLAVAEVHIISSGPTPGPTIVLDEMGTPPAEAERATPAPVEVVPSATPTREAATPTEEVLPPSTPTEAEATPTPTQSPTPRPTATPEHITAIGDSVMLGAAWTLQHTFSDIEVDAAVSRPFSTATEILRGLREAGRLGPVVLVHMGNNGPISNRQFDEMMQVLYDMRLVIFVNLNVHRTWEAPNNAVLCNGVRRYANTAYIDWLAASIEHPEYFWEDGIHLRPEGAQTYAGLIAACLKASPSRVPSRPLEE